MQNAEANLNVRYLRTPTVAPTLLSSQSYACIPPPHAHRDSCRCTTSLTYRCRCGSTGRPNAAVHSPIRRARLVLQEVYVEVGSGRAGGPWTPTGCPETQAQRARRRLRAQCNASVHAVVAVADRRRCHLLDAWSPLTDPKVRTRPPSGLTSPRRSTTRSSLPQGSSGRLPAPTSSGPTTTASSRPQDRSLRLRG